jgi:hypothetical protein
MKMMNLVLAALVVMSAVSCTKKEETTAPATEGSVSAPATQPTTPAEEPKKEEAPAAPAAH